MDLKEGEVMVHTAFDILFNLMENKYHRKKLAENGYLTKLFAKFEAFAD